MTFLEGRGYLPELFSGDLLQSVDAAVPHQLFATTGFVSGVMRGLVGLEEVDGEMRLSPHLPPGWDFLRVKNLRWRGASGDLDVRRGEDGTVTFQIVDRAGSCLPAVIGPPIPPGADSLNVWGASDSCNAGRPGGRPGASVNAGIALIPERPPLELGDASQRLRIVEASVDGDVYTARLQGLRGRTYRVRLDVPFVVQSIAGGRETGHDGHVRTIDITVPDGPTDWIDCLLVVRIGPRLR